MLPVSEKTFKQEVLDSSIPVLVNFWAPWCGLCRRITPILQGFQSDWISSVKVVSVNADENLKLANTYRLTTLPTLLLIRDGEVTYRLDHVIDQRELRLNLDRALATETFSFSSEARY